MSPASSAAARTRHLRVKEILFEALERDESVRSAWIREACAGDHELSREVESLLADFDRDDGFLEEPPPLVSAASTREPGPPVLPERIGRFRVQRLLGWGGMGVVYLAEQDHPRRPVALKVLRMDCAGEDARRRLQREAEALGRLQHPGIAKIHEAGVALTDAGSQPYLAMEYVEGPTIREHCRLHRLDSNARLELLARVADAVHHAHECGVLHRDLKPDNVLVDGRCEPRVLDFGVARITVEGARDSFHTLTGQVLGTVAYMSPEQARGADVDARSDQYSLGVILYELLTDRLPFDTQGHGVAQLMRTVAEQEPHPLAILKPELRGDVATIVHKAMAQDPARRYPTVHALASDVRRFLAGRPIHARPPTTFYQLRKLVTRHRGLAAGVATVIAALTLGLGFAVVGMREARAAEERARLESDLVLRLSHVKLLEELVAREKELWPIGPERLSEMDEWLADAEELREMLPEHERQLVLAEAFEREGRLNALLTGGMRVRGGAEWYVSMLGELVGALRELVAEPDGLLASVMERRRLSAELVSRTIDAERAAWDLAIAAIESDPVYAGLVIEPQVGLVPLGPDPASGLQEFALHGPTGAVPRRDPETGELLFDEDSAPVFVLLPGGGSLIGGQREDPGAPNHSPWLQAHEGPPRLVVLDPFLASKFEVTQAQWLRLEGSNPSHWEAGDDTGAQVITARHPVETVSWLDAQRFAAKLGCTLPTEAQWEYAARGGTTTAWWTGADWRSLRGRANLANRPRKSGDETEAGREAEEWEPWRVHAPAGTFPANPFGLHEVLGNVSEWCLDGYKVRYFELPLREGDGLVLADGGGDYTYRGGNSYNQPEALRVTKRLEARAYHRVPLIGLRLVRRVNGEWRRSRG